MGGMEEEREGGKVSEPGAARQLQMEERQVDGKARMASEPGAARHGNFINYYEFHPPEERLRLLPDDFGRRISPAEKEGSATLVLDVGCNAGVSSSSSSYLFQIEARQPHHGSAGCGTAW